MSCLQGIYFEWKWLENEVHFKKEKNKIGIPYRLQRNQKINEESILWI
jgi:hypothetical protein